MGGSPLGPPRTRGRSGAEPLAGFLGEPGVVCGAGGDAALGHPSAGHQLLPPPLPPLELRAYGNRELSPVLFQPHGNNSSLSL